MSKCVCVCVRVWVLAGVPSTIVRGQTKQCQENVVKAET